MYVLLVHMYHLTLYDVRLGEPKKIAELDDRYR